MVLRSGLVLAAFVTLCGGASMARDLTVVGFGGSLQDAMRATLWQPFSRQIGAPLIDESYTGGIAKIKAMVESGTTNWDVVQMDENEMILACDEGILERFDWNSSTRTSEIIPSARSTCGVGAFATAMGDATATRWAMGQDHGWTSGIPSECRLPAFGECTRWGLGGITRLRKVQTSLRVRVTVPVGLGHYR